MGKIASMATLPLMAVVILLAARAVGTTARDRTPPAEGILVVANLRDESLTFHDLAGETGTRTLAVPGPPHEMVSRGGRVYATLGRGNAVAEVDPYAPGILRTMELPGEPHGIAADGESLLITLDKANAVVVTDIATLAEVDRRPTGEAPHAIAVAGTEAYIAVTRENRIEAQRADGAAASTGGLPESIAVTDRYVATANAADGTLSVFRRDDLRLVGNVTLGGAPVRVVALDSERVAVALNSKAEALVVNMERMRIERRVKVGARPDGLCLSPAGTFIAVVSNADNLARVYRLPEWTPVLALVTGEGPGACLWFQH